MKFHIEQYPGKYAMHCATEEDAQTFLEFLTSINRSWSNGNSYIGNTNFNKYRNETGYDFNQGKYGGIPWYTENGYTVLEFTDFEWDDDITPPTDSDLKRFTTFFAQFKVS